MADLNKYKNYWTELFKNVFCKVTRSIDYT